MRLIIKGSPEDAAKAAELRSIPLSRIDEHPSLCEAIAYTEEASLRRVVAWFCEPGEAPFAPGSLLFYS